MPRRTSQDALGDAVAIRTVSPDQMADILDMNEGLSSAGIEHDVAVPRLVSTGDTSAGKSSVLERLTGLPFQVGEGVVTRFATEVAMRPDKKSSVTLTVLSGDNRTRAEQTILGRFRKTITKASEFPKAYAEAAKAMGANKTKAGLLGDRLRVEVRGPECAPMNIIDLPGLIQATSADTTDEDRKLSYQILQQYIKSPRTIILAVVSAANDIRNQAITRYAREVDPEGKRTMGIITKPDTLKKRSTNEDQWMRLAQNEEIKFELGWHVLVNKVEKVDNATAEEVKAAEAKFFAHERFVELNPKQLGVDNLTTRLCDVANKHLLEALPELQHEIQAKLDEATIHLADLGFLRADPRARRTFMASMSRSFENKAIAAVDGHYTDEYFRPEGESDRRLRAQVRMLNDDFARAMRSYGAILRIEHAVNVVDADKGIDSKRKCEYVEWVSRGKDMKRDKALEWVGQKLDICQGSELPGGVNPALVKQLFWELSQNWEGLAAKHITKVAQKCGVFVKALLKEVVGKSASEVRHRLCDKRLDPFMKDASSSAFKSLTQLVDDEKKAPMTYNYAAIQAARAQQNTKVVHAAEANGMAYGGLPHRNSDMQQAADALDQVMAFYYAELNFFIDAVNRQVIDREVVLQLPKLLSTEWAASLSDDELTTLAEESPKVLRERKELEATRNRMSTALEQFKSRLGRLL